MYLLHLERGHLVTLSIWYFFIYLVLECDWSNKKGCKILYKYEPFQYWLRVEKVSAFAIWHRTLRKFAMSFTGCIDIIFIFFIFFYLKFYIDILSE